MSILNLIPQKLLSKKSKKFNKNDSYESENNKRIDLYKILTVLTAIPFLPGNNVPQLASINDFSQQQPPSGLLERKHHLATFKHSICVIFKKKIEINLKLFFC